MSGKKKTQKKKNEGKNSALLLGRDVWLEILQYFDDPRDIICLRMVSKPLQGFTLESVVWNRFLRTQCAVNYVPACTFPFSDMDRNQLELAALRPFRMAHKLLSPEPMCVSQSVLRLCPNITAAESATEKIMETAIIPGGRYLVTISSAQLIVVWDLWSSLLPKGDRKLCPRALALIDPPEPLPGEISVNIQLTPTKNSSSYRIILGVDGDEENVWNFYHLVVDLLQLSTRKEKNNMKEGVWEALGTSLADVITTPDGRYLAIVESTRQVITIRDLFEDISGQISHRFITMDSYVVFDPTPDSRHIYVTIITPDSGETLLCLFQVPLLAGSASGIANSNTPEPSQPLDVRLVEMELKYCVDTPTGLGTTLPKSANAVLFGKKSAPRFYRFGDLALPAKNRHHLRVLLPAERLGEHVEPFVHCRGLWLGKTFLVLSCNAGRLHCQVSTIIESDDAATATAPLRLIGFVPSDVRIFHVTRNPWQGELLVCAPSGAWGEVHVYQYTSD